MTRLTLMKAASLFAAPAFALAAVACAGLVLAAPRPAAPAGGTPGVLGSSSAPIDVTAENSEMFQNEHRQVFWGNVEVIQGQSRLRTPRLTTFFTPRDGGAPKAASATPGADMGQVERIEAEGTVFYVTPTQKAKGDHATYLASSDTVTMTGNVVLVQDKDVATGDKLVIEQKTGHATLTSNGGKSGQGRVRAVLYPSQNNQAGATPGGAPPANAPAAKPPGRP